MQKILNVLTAISSTLLISVTIYFNYIIFFPFDVLVVDDIPALKYYQETKPWYDNYRYLFVAPAIFGEPHGPVLSGEVINFEAGYIYNFGVEPTYKATLKCKDEDDHYSIYSVATNGNELPLIGTPGELRVGESNYNIIDSNAKGKTCRLEFDTVYQLLFRHPITKTLVTPWFLVE